MAQVGREYRRSNVMCDRRFDEAKAGGARTYILSHSSITAAVDSHHAFLKALQYDKVRAHATWGMIRPSFEAAFYAVWMLQPDTARERLRRGLRVTWEEHRMHIQRFELQKELLAAGEVSPDDPELLRLAQVKREHEALYLAEARSLGMSDQQMRQRVNLTEELTKLVYGDELPSWIGTWYTLMWRSLSGATHGDSGAIMGLSDKSYKFKIPGGMTAQVSVNDTAFVGACYASAMLQMMAMELYIQRCIPAG